MFTMGNAGLGEEAAGEDDDGDFDIASMLAQRNRDEMAAMVLVNTVVARVGMGVVLVYSGDVLCSKELFTFVKSIVLRCFQQRSSTIESQNA